MEKHCANHPESMAVATCKACSKSVCLMCVSDEREGTFCSGECHQAFVSGAPVPQAAPPTGGDAIASIFDPEPSPSTSLNLPEGPEPIVAEGTKWRPIGAKCENHPDTDAVANCDRCGKTVCPLCLLEAAAGTFCSSECMMGTASQPAPAEQSAIQKATPPPPPAVAAPRPAPAPAARSAPVNVMATGRAHKKGGGGLAAAIIILILLGVGGYFGWDYYEKNLAPLHSADADPVVPPPQPPKPPADPPKPPADPPKPPADPPKPPADPPKPPTPAEPKPPPVELEPVKKPPKKEPPRPRLTKFLNPWNNEEEGTWYRIRIVEGSAVTITDIGVKSKGESGILLQSQTAKGGRSGPVTEQNTGAQPVYLSGEETFTFNDRPYLSEIRQYDLETTAPRTWALIQGKHAGAVMRAELPEGLLSAKRVWDHELRLGYRVFECLVVESAVEKDGKTLSTAKTWYTSQVPMGLLREEKPGYSWSVIAWGTEWAKRPPFPAP